MNLSLAQQLVAYCDDIHQQFEIPGLRHIYFPPENEKKEKNRKFGLVVLLDDSTGFFFTLLAGNNDSVQFPELPKHPLDLARLYLCDDTSLKAIGLGAINAISQFYFKRCSYLPENALNPLGNFNFDQHDRVGMVGYFPALVHHLRQAEIPLTVIELEQEMVQEHGAFKVTLDTSALSSCNKILCTASTLINGTLEEILQYCKNAESVALIGPSASCIPDPLLKLGISVIGGSIVNNYALLEQRCNAGTDWADTVSKYTLTSDNYPGFDQLLKANAHG